MNDIKLTEEQLEAFTILLARAQTPGSESVLSGVAGAGKSTLMKMLLEAVDDAGINCVLGATTGRAALRLGRLTGRKANTAHSLLYEQPKVVAGRLIFSEKKPPCLSNDLLIIDEASMMGKAFYDELMGEVPNTARVLFIGDHEQLPPVKDTWGPDLQSPTVRLETVHRQALDSPIIGYATGVREGRGKEWERKFLTENDSEALYTVPDRDAAVEWYLELHACGLDAVIIAFAHKTRKAFNTMIRDELGREDEYDLQVGDKLVVKSNNRATGYMNGEVVTITKMHGEVSRDGLDAFHVELDGEKNAYIPLAFIEAPNKDFWEWRRELGSFRELPDWLHVHLGHCLTVHSVQGSQFDHVLFYKGSGYHFLRRERPDEARRLHYTAVTRAVESLVIGRP